jgi:hypothetical protein
MLPVVAAVLLAALMVAAAIGYWLPRLLAKPTAVRSEGASLIMGGATGLMGLLIAFTLAMSSERYEARRELVVAEANALSTAYLRDSALPGAAGAHLDTLIAQYGQERLAFFDAGRDQARLRQVALRTDALQDEIWRETMAALVLPHKEPVDTAVIFSTNEMFDLASSRMAARQWQVPSAILWLLIFISIGTAGLCGYNLGLHGDRHIIATSVLLVMIAVSIGLIFDMDEPTLGLIWVPQEPLVNEVADMKARELHRQSFIPADLAGDPAQ